MKMVLMLLFCSLIAPGIGRANEGGEGAAPAAQGKAEGEGGEGKKEGGPPPASREATEFFKKEARLNTLRSRIEDTDLRFKEALRAKAHAKEKSQKQELANTMAAISKERNGYVKEFTLLRQEVKYRYPNKGEEIDRRFIPQKEKTQHELESTSELDQQLTTVKKRMDKKFAPLLPPSQENLDVIAPSAKDKEPAPKLKLVK